MEEEAEYCALQNIHRWRGGVEESLDSDGLGRLEKHRGRSADAVQCRAGPSTIARVKPVAGNVYMWGRHDRGRRTPLAAGAELHAMALHFSDLDLLRGDELLRLRLVFLVFHPAAWPLRPGSGAKLHHMLPMALVSRWLTLQRSISKSACQSSLQSSPSTKRESTG